MPSHPDRVRRSYLCPYCQENILDGKHTISNFKFAHMVGCPKYPRNENPSFINNDNWDAMKDPNLIAFMEWKP